MSERTTATASAAVTTTAALAAGFHPTLAVLLSVTAVAAVTDAYRHTIPNRISLLAAVAAAGVWTAAGAPVTALLMAAVLAAVLLTLWTADLMGGGDVKLIPSLALAAAATGPADAATARLGVLLILLWGISSLWAAGQRSSDVPLAVGAAFALAAAVVI
ncbi:prepilin peptidase [Microbacterium sp. 77mftsu3.1]|uniref:prepilin peptidase n=1 Tax=Microbacterium sp. 77mftsu3.1 TaxID=1761802 RepID=UPI00035D0949|nr:prepilin peptidase [Microbacterium sp. 77mftsu3.1]SDH50982.1 Type IV leader peptidase family protein [Microbacterium sp. 77mftsu3.1]